MKISIPEKLSEITVGQYLKYSTVIGAEEYDEEFDNFAIVTIFCGLTVSEAKQIPRKEIKEISLQIRDVLKQEPRFIHKFNHDGVKYGFIPNLDDITAGEYIDLDKYMSDESTLLNAMSVLYRPITKSIGSSYIIEPYESSEKYKHIMENVSLEVLLGAQVFFWNLSKELLNCTKAYLQNLTMEETGQAHLEKSGDGIKASIRLLTETGLILKPLRHLEFMNS